jgi:hypothetical protein
MECRKCGFDHAVFPVNEKQNFFEFESRGDKIIVLRKNEKSNFYCGVCDLEFEVYLPKPKVKPILDCLYTDIDFADWKYEIKLKSEKGKGVLWLQVYNGKSNTYFCKVWGKELMDKIENNDFSEGTIWTGEIRMEMNLKDGKKGQAFSCVNFNIDTVNMRNV